MTFFLTKKAKNYSKYNSSEFKHARINYLDKTTYTQYTNTSTILIGIKCEFLSVF